MRRNAICFPSGDQTSRCELKRPYPWAAWAMAPARREPRSPGPVTRMSRPRMNARRRPSGLHSASRDPDERRGADGGHRSLRAKKRSPIPLEGPRGARWDERDSPGRLAIEALPSHRCRCARPPTRCAAQSASANPSPLEPTTLRRRLRRRGSRMRRGRAPPCTPWRTGRRSSASTRPTPPPLSDELDPPRYWERLSTTAQATERSRLRGLPRNSAPPNPAALIVAPAVGDGVDDARACARSPRSSSRRSSRRRAGTTPSRRRPGRCGGSGPRPGRASRGPLEVEEGHVGRARQRDPLAAHARRARRSAADAPVWNACTASSRAWVESRPSRCSASGSARRAAPGPRGGRRTRRAARRRP